MIKKALICAVRFYQKYISHLKRRPTCKYYPTCSCYALEALERYGAIKGGAMSAYRILRCNPFSKGGYDPVPELSGKDRKRRTR